MGRDADLVVALAWGALAGGVLQLLVQTPWLLPLLSGFRLSLGRRVTGVREAIRNFLPVVAGRGVVNLSGWIDMILAHILVVGAPAMLGYAQTLYMLPISIFGMAIAASELPELSRRRGEIEEVLVPRVRGALERIAFLLIPSALAYLVLGDVFIAALFQRGEFGPDATAATYVILAAYALGLPASASSRALSSAFYAVRDTRTPAVIATGRVVISVAVGASPHVSPGPPGRRRPSAGGRRAGLGIRRGSLGGVRPPSAAAHPTPGPARAPAEAGRSVLRSRPCGRGSRDSRPKLFLGFSAEPGLLPDLLGEASVWLNPLAALGTAWCFRGSLSGDGVPSRGRDAPPTETALRQLSSGLPWQHPTRSPPSS